MNTNGECGWAVPRKKPDGAMKRNATEAGGMVQDAAAKKGKTNQKGAGQVAN